MNTPEIIMLVCMVLIGVPAAWWNLSALGLVGGYFLLQGAFYVGAFEGMEPAELSGILFGVDMTVVALIFAKALDTPSEMPDLSLGHLARRSVRLLTPHDRAIVALFVLGTWPVYIVNIAGHHRWWALWSIAMLQLLISAAEPFNEWRRARRANEPDMPSSGLFRSAWAGAGQWST